MLASFVKIGIAAVFYAAKTFYLSLFIFIRPLPEPKSAVKRTESTPFPSNDRAGAPETTADSGRDGACRCG